jgi:hypothetical protein
MAHPGWSEAFVALVELHDARPGRSMRRSLAGIAVIAIAATLAGMETRSPPFRNR